jgi:hypothetical protein
VLGQAVAAPALALGQALEAPPPPSISPLTHVTPPSSTLNTQNDLFGAALRARRNGDVGRAVRRLDELLTGFPDGPLAESAERERRRLDSEQARGRPAAAH